MFDHKGSVMNIFSLGCTFEEKFLNHCYGKNPTKFNEGGWIILSQVGGSMKLKRAQLLQHQQLQQRQLQQQQQQKSKKPINLFSPTHWSKEHRNGWQWRSWSRSWSWLLLVGGGGRGEFPLFGGNRSDKELNFCLRRWIINDDSESFQGKETLIRFSKVCGSWSSISGKSWTGSDSIDLDKNEF